MKPWLPFSALANFEHLDYYKHTQPPRSYGPFSVEERPGEQWISLKRKFGEEEEIKIEATMFDKSVPTSKSTKTEPEFLLHITFIVNISKESAGEETLEIMCSAWPDNIEISKLCVRKGVKTSPSSYGGPEFEYGDLIPFLEHKNLMMILCLPLVILWFCLWLLL